MLPCPHNKISAVSPTATRPHVWPTSKATLRCGPSPAPAPAPAPVPTPCCCLLAILDKVEGARAEGVVPPAACLCPDWAAWAALAELSGLAEVLVREGGLPEPKSRVGDGGAPDPEARPGGGAPEPDARPDNDCLPDPDGPELDDDARIAASCLLLGRA